MAKRVGLWVAIVVALALGYLIFWPVPVEPQAWTPPRAPEARPLNDELAGVEQLRRGELPGPEATAIDSKGTVYTGLSDGRVVRLLADGGALETVVNTGGRPLGMTFDTADELFICDTDRGLLRLSADGGLRTLATMAQGVPFRFTDDVAVAKDGTAYFTDASSKWDVRHYTEDILEYGANGRVLALAPGASEPSVVREGLHFANGVALSGDERFLLVSETSSYRVLRYWLSTERAGTWDTFVENLPGFPDNITYSKERGVFWLALFGPRNPALDRVRPYPFLVKAVWRLPELFRPKVHPHAQVLGLDEQGQVVHDLQHLGEGAFFPVTSVREHGGVLHLGSLTHDALGRMSAPPRRP